MTESSNGVAGKNGNPKTSVLKSALSFFITFVLMFLTWIVLSGNFKGLLIGLGLISSFVTAYFFKDLLFPAFEQKYVRIFFRFNGYTIWLIREIIKANIHMIYLAFHPQIKEKIDPHIITFKTNLKSDLAITTLANSITLTPGTTTVTADRDGVFRVHAIDKVTAEGCPGVMLEKVAYVFGEEI